MQIELYRVFACNLSMKSPAIGLSSATERISSRATPTPSQRAAGLAGMSAPCFLDILRRRRSELPHSALWDIPRPSFGARLLLPSRRRSLHQPRPSISPTSPSPRTSCQEGAHAVCTAPWQGVLSVVSRYWSWSSISRSSSILQARDGGARPEKNRACSDWWIWLPVDAVSAVFQRLATNMHGLGKTCTPACMFRSSRSVHYSLKNP